MELVLDALGYGAAGLLKGLTYLVLLLVSVVSGMLVALGIQAAIFRNHKNRYKQSSDE